MASERSRSPPAQCSVPNITLVSADSEIQAAILKDSVAVTPLSQPSPTAPSTPGQSHSGNQIGNITLLPRPSSAPNSLPTAASTSENPYQDSTTSSQTDDDLLRETNLDNDVDVSIVEALKSSKDRLYVLKLGETMESLIQQGKLYAKVELQPASSYQRLLVFRCAALYRLTPETTHSSISVIVTTESRIPSKRIVELVPPEESVLPAFQIMRRTDRSKTTSRAASLDGNLTDDGNESTRSQGSGSRKKQYRTIEERELEYIKARSRIFMDFDEKETSTSSAGALSSAASTVSYTGGSAGMSSVDGDGASTAPTESEYSGPAVRAKEPRTGTPYNGNNSRGRNGNNNNPGTSTLRSSAPPFMSNSVSPPPPTGTVHFLPQLFDPNAPSQGQNGAPANVPQPGVFPPYPPPLYGPYYLPYYYPYSYPPPAPGMAPPSGQHPGQDQQQAENGNAGQNYPMAPPPQPYPGYMWGPHGYMPPPTQGPPPAPQPQISRPPSQASFQSHQTPQNQPPLPPNFNGYQGPPGSFPPMVGPPGSFHPNGPPGMRPNNPGPFQQPQMPPPPVPNNGWPPPGMNNPNPGAISPPHSVRQGSGSDTASNNGGTRRAPPRNAWQKYPFPPNQGAPPPMTNIAGVPVASLPRSPPEGLKIRVMPPINLESPGGSSAGSNGSLRKRTSTNTAGSSGSGSVRLAGDETSSIASSSSSSSKRTYTSTTSSQPQHHPLPERPDWAVNLRPASTTHHKPRAQPHFGLRGVPQQGIHASSTPLSSTTSLGSSNSTSSSGDAMSKEFPPLGDAAPLRGSSSQGGVWNGGVTRSLSSESLPSGAEFNVTTPPGMPKGLVQHSNSGASSQSGVEDSFTSRLDEYDTTFVRPPPKGNADLFNPRGNMSNSRQNSKGAPSPSQANGVGILSQLMRTVDLGRDSDEGEAVGSRESDVDGVAKSTVGDTPSLYSASGSSFSATTDDHR